MRISDWSSDVCSSDLVKADLAVWPLRFVATGNDLAAVQQKIVNDTRLVQEFLATNGFPPEAFEGQSLQVVDRLAQQYQQGEVESRFIIAQTITLRSGDVDRKSTRLNSSH